MKFALQIYGEFRCFEKCIDDILYFIDYYNKDFDVFILTQKNSKTYSQENLNKIKKILGEKNIKIFNFVEDYPKEILEKENEMVKQYIDLLEKLRKDHDIIYSGNYFVTSLYYRRWLINEARKEYEKENNIFYDFVIRTRFDIGFRNEKEIFNYNRTPYFSWDILSIGKPSIIDKESELGLIYPYIPKNFFDENLNKVKITDKEILEKWEMCEKEIFHKAWVFMPEVNSKAYLFFNYKKEMLSSFQGIELEIKR